MRRFATRSHAAMRIKHVALVAVAITALLVPAAARGEAGDAASPIVVAPNGTSNAQGTVASPLDLSTAVGSSSPVRPGGVVLLRSGVYRGAYVSSIAGTPDAPITIRSYPGEWAVIDGGATREPALTVRGDDTWVRDLEITKSDPARVSRQSGPHPTDIARGTSESPYVLGDGIYVFGRRAKLVNLVVHDAGNGIGFWRWYADNAELYGNIIYNNGWLGVDGGWGHGIYTQNTWGTKTIADNVIFNNFGFGVHAYDKSIQLSGYDIHGNVAFENGSAGGQPRANIFVGTSSGSVDRINVSDNIAYHRSPAGDNVRLGLTMDTSTGENGAITVNRNTIVGGMNSLVMLKWRNAQVTENEVITKPSSYGNTNGVKLYSASSGTSSALPELVWDKNTYVDPYVTSTSWPPSFQFHDARTSWMKQRLSLPKWRSTTGYDRASQYLKAPSQGVRVIVQPNGYDVGRAFVTVLNHARQNEVAVPLETTGLKVGQQFSIRDVQNLGGDPVYSGVYTGLPVVVPTTATSVAQPIGSAPVSVAHTPREFNVFLVVPGAQS